MKEDTQTACRFCWWYAGAADCVREHGEPAAGARFGARNADRGPAGDGRNEDRLVRQSLTESVVLSVLGGVAGIFVAFAGVKAVVALAFHGAHYVPIDATPSLPVLGFAFGLSLMTGVLFGTAPAWLASHTDPAAVLHGAGRTTRDGTSMSQKMLVVVQATLSVVLLAGAGLLTRSLMKMQHQNFGFEIDQRVSLGVNAPFSSYSPAKLDATYRTLQERLTQIPGVERAALASIRLSGQLGRDRVRQGQGMSNMRIGRVILGSRERRIPGDDGATIVRGRSITEQDTASTQNIAVVDEAFVKKFFKPGEEPIGTHFGMNDPQYGGMFEIVGIVRTRTIP